jgi:hypothetical protein
MFFLFSLAYNFRIHKAFDINKIELQDMRKIFFKNIYKKIFSEIPFTLEILFFKLMYVSITPAATSSYLTYYYTNRAITCSLSKF